MQNKEFKIFGFAKEDIKAGQYLAVNTVTGETFCTTQEAIVAYNDKLRKEIERAQATETMSPKKSAPVVTVQEVPKIIGVTPEKIITKLN